MSSKMMTHAASVFVVVVVLTAGLVLVNNYDAGGSDGDTITVTDMFGRDVEVPTDVERVVAVNSGCLRFVTYMSGAEKIVGVEAIETDAPGGRAYTIAHPEYGNKTVIGPIHGGDQELIASVQPDVIFKAAGQASELDDLQNAIGVPVVGLTGTVDFSDEKIDDFFRQLRLIGTVLDNEQRAEDLIDFINDIITDLDDRTSSIPEAERPSAYVGGVAYSGAHGIDWCAAVYPPFDFLNVNNVINLAMTSDRPVGQISMETVFSLDPEYIFIDNTGRSLVQAQYDDLTGDFQGMQAFSNGDVYGVMPYNWYYTNYCTLLANCYYVGTVLYPDQFSDINATEKADEIYTFMVGAPVYAQLEEGLGGGYGPIDFSA